jgi:circadian clock protein KaiC
LRTSLSSKASHSNGAANSAVAFEFGSRFDGAILALLQSLAFFDAALLGDAVQFFTLASLITAEDATPDTAIARTIRASGAKVVLLDGFQSADALIAADRSIRAILFALATQIRYLDTTLLVTIADAAIVLNYTVQGRRQQRLMEIVELRGRAQQPGLHSYQIDSTGVQVFPRLESSPALIARPPTFERMSFQLPELDRLLRRGPNVGTTTLLAGAPGVDKTTLGLHLTLAQAKPAPASVFVSFAEHPEQLMRKAAVFRLDLQLALEDGSVRIVRFASAEINPDYVASVLLRELATPEMRRLVIDDISILLHELGERTRDYLSALNELVYGAHVTGMYLLEIAAFDGLRVNLANSPLAVLGDNVIVMEQYEVTGHLRRVLAVLRMLLSFFAHTLRELTLDESGFRIATPDESTLKLLATSRLGTGGDTPQTWHDAASNTAA